jgi:hypothetical protein
MSLVKNIEGFDATKLKHTETQEKNPLPDKDGKLAGIISVIFARRFLLYFPPFILSEMVFPLFFFPDFSLLLFDDFSFDFTF